MPGVHIPPHVYGFSSEYAMPVTWRNCTVLRIPTAKPSRTKSLARKVGVISLAYCYKASLGMASFTLAAASVHVRAVSMCRRALNVTLRAYSTQQFLARVQPRFAATTPVAVHCNAFSALASTGGTTVVVLVKVGTGVYSPLDADVKKMHRSGFLKTLKADDTFATKLQNVPLDECKVWVLPAVAGDVPTPTEEKDGIELTGIKEISSIFKLVDSKGVEQASPISKLVLRVALPPTTRGPGKLRYHFCRAVDGNMRS
jgi:hypothetical protein